MPCANGMAVFQILFTDFDRRPQQQLVGQLSDQHPGRGRGAQREQCPILLGGQANFSRGRLAEPEERPQLMAKSRQHCIIFVTQIVGHLRQYAIGVGNLL